MLSQIKFLIKISNTTLHATHGDDERIGGTGQGSLLCVLIFVVQSCATFKFLEGMHQGIVLCGMIGNDALKRLILAYVDDFDVFSEGENAL